MTRRAGRRAGSRDRSPARSARGRTRRARRPTCRAAQPTSVATKPAVVVLVDAAHGGGGAGGSTAGAGGIGRATISGSVGGRRRRRTSAATVSTGAAGASPWRLSQSTSGTVETGVPRPRPLVLRRGVAAVSPRTRHRRQRRRVWSEDRLVRGRRRPRRIASQPRPQLAGRTARCRPAPAITSGDRTRIVVRRERRVGGADGSTGASRCVAIDERDQHHHAPSRCSTMTAEAPGSRSGPGVERRRRHAATITVASLRSTPGSTAAAGPHSRARPMRPARSDVEAVVVGLAEREADALVEPVRRLPRRRGSSGSPPSRPAAAPPSSAAPVEHLADAVPARRVVDHDVLDPRLQPGRDAERHQRQRCRRCARRDGRRTATLFGIVDDLGSSSSVGGGDDDDSCGIRRASASTISSVASRRRSRRTGCIGARSSRRTLPPARSAGPGRP